MLTVRRIMTVVLLALIPAVAGAQEVTRSVSQQAIEPNDGTGRDAGTGPDGQEARPGSPDGDYPSASAGRLTRSTAQWRILGLPVDALLVIGAVLLGLISLAGLVLPRPRRRARRFHS